MNGRINKKELKNNSYEKNFSTITNVLYHKNDKTVRLQFYRGSLKC